MSIGAEMVSDEYENEQPARYADGETRYVQQRVGTLHTQVSESCFSVIAEHERFG
ncbi:hypothetical protein GCM10028807_19290 [Spirosoma daeguense]